MPIYFNWLNYIVLYEEVRFVLYEAYDFNYYWAYWLLLFRDGFMLYFDSITHPLYTGLLEARGIYKESFVYAYIFVYKGILFF